MAATPSLNEPIGLRFSSFIEVPQANGPNEPRCRQHRSAALAQADHMFGFDR